MSEVEKGDTESEFVTVSSLAWLPYGAEVSVDTLPSLSASSVLLFFALEALNLSFFSSSPRTNSSLMPTLQHTIIINKQHQHSKFVTCENLRCD